MVIPPVELDDFLRRDIPKLKVSPNTQGNEPLKVRIALNKPRNGGTVQVVVVVVRNDDRIDVRQVVKCQGWRVETLWPGPRERRSPLRPDWVDKCTHTVDLNQEGRVPIHVRRSPLSQVDCRNLTALGSEPAAVR